jgi:hypothetical protein
MGNPERTALAVVAALAFASITAPAPTWARTTRHHHRAPAAAAAPAAPATDAATDPAADPATGAAADPATDAVADVAPDPSPPAPSPAKHAHRHHKALVPVVAPADPPADATADPSTDQLAGASPDSSAPAAPPARHARRHHKVLVPVVAPVDATADALTDPSTDQLADATPDIGAPTPPPTRHARRHHKTLAPVAALADLGIDTPTDQPLDPAADPDALTAPSATVAGISEWSARTGDNQGRPFMVIDKPTAEVYVFDASGELIDKAPALLGVALGDDAAPGVGDLELSNIPMDERTTEAGRFVAHLGPAQGMSSVLWVDFGSSLSLHPVITSNPREQRLQRLRSPSPEDRRITHGCINVPAKFYRDVVSKTFAGSEGVVYILPDTEPLDQVFPQFALQADIHTGKAKRHRRADPVSSDSDETADAPVSGFGARF